MGLYKEIDRMQINGLCDIPAAQKMVYVYKLTHINSGLFYIGQTHSVKGRIYQHLTAILEEINGTGKKLQPFHVYIADVIKKDFATQSQYKIERFTREAFSIYIIALLGEQKVADLVENFYITNEQGNPLCLNAAFK